MSSLLLIVRRSLRQHLFSTLITVFSIALAAGLVLSVFAIEKRSRDAFTGGSAGFDAVLGARGSKLQLVLNTVFHLETSPGNIPWATYDAIRKDRRISMAIPFALGDNYEGFRIIGTSEEMLTEVEHERGKKIAFYEGGRPFDPNRREAVIGAFVAQKTGLRVGSSFQPTHGLTSDETSHVHDEEYKVVGITRPTNTPSDRVVWIPIEGIFRMEGHVLRGTGAEYTPEAGQAIPDEHKELSAVMLKFRNPMTGNMLNQQINNQGNVATLAWPIAQVMGELFDKLGWMNEVLKLVAYLVVIVAVASVSAVLYNALNERRREFAILRALGARRFTVFSAIILEAATIAFLGAMLGYVIYGGIMMGAAWLVQDRTGVVLDITRFEDFLWQAPLLIVATGALAGVIPAINAYSTDVADNLTPHS